MRDVLWLSIVVGNLSRCQMLSDLYYYLSCIVPFIVLYLLLTTPRLQ